MSNKIVIALAFALITVLAGCNTGPSANGDPKQRLNDYISRSFGIHRIEERTELLSFLSGEAKTQLTAWSDDQFRQAFIESKRQFLKLLFTEIKTVAPQEVNVTYEISYIDQGKGHDAKVTNKKLAQMIRENGVWYIKGVRNIKELVEYKNEMSLP